MNMLFKNQRADGGFY